MNSSAAHTTVIILSWDPAVQSLAEAETEWPLKSCHFCVIMSVVLFSDWSHDEYLAKKFFFTTHEGNAVLDRHFKLFLLSFFK